MNKVKRGVWIGALAVIGWGGAPGISQAVQCQNNLPPSNPNAVYQDHGNGTVTDTRTGLMWQQCSEGQSWSPGTCSGTPSGFTWSQALARADAATFAGHADWRVPNVKELSSLVEDCRGDPAINNVLFPNLFPNTLSGGSVFWAASPYAIHSDAAWSVNFGTGGAPATPFGATPSTFVSCAADSDFIPRSGFGGGRAGSVNRSPHRRARRWGSRRAPG